MTVFDNRRQENIWCYNNLEWQLSIEWRDVPAVQKQYGRNFSVSVIPYRSPPLIYTSRASLLKDMPKPWPTTSRCPRCGASYQVVRIEDGWNAETVRGLLARLWGGLSRAETDCPS